MVEAQEFAEQALVHGNRYGTAIATVNRAIEEGMDCLFDIDYQGGQQIRRQWPDESVLCFILPPSLAELERRLRRRATDAPEAIERRLAIARKELEHYSEYDYLVVNDDLEKAFAELSAIYIAARCARMRSEGYALALLAEVAGAAQGEIAINDRRCPSPTSPRCLESVRSHDPTADVGLVGAATSSPPNGTPVSCAARASPTSSTRWGWPRIIADLRLDVPSVCAGLLHDCVEDTSATAEDIGRLFGAEIQFLVEGVTKLGQIPWNTREERQAENFRKMLLAMARDIRVILIKLADRVDNMRTLEHMPRDKQERIARETLEIYAPLANRLGIQWMKVELEDLSFRYLEPEDFAALTERMADTDVSRQQYIDRDVGQAARGRCARRASRPGVRARQAPVVDPPEDEEDRPRRRADLTTSSPSALIVGIGARLLRRARAWCTRTGRRSRGASRTSSRCPSRTCTSRCTPR